MATSGAAFAEFGGSTSCYMVRAGEHAVLLDAGSGILHAPASCPEVPTILLTHWHLDHIMGLGMYGGLSRAGTVTNLYAPGQSDEDVRRTLEGVFSVPYWPLRLSEYPAGLIVRAMPQSLRIDNLLVQTMEGHHPGGCLVYKLTYDGKSIVCATDFEHESTSFDRLVKFCTGSQLVLYDAQYTDEEYLSRKGFGHSTARKAIELREKSGVEQMLLVHHDPQATDDVLRKREKALGATGVRIAREGEVIEL